VNASPQDAARAQTLETNTIQLLAEARTAVLAGQIAVAQGVIGGVNENIGLYVVDIAMATFSITSVLIQIFCAGTSLIMITTMTSFLVITRLGSATGIAGALQRV
jgi:hypothetical protein